LLIRNPFEPGVSGYPFSMSGVYIGQRENPRRGSSLAQGL